MCGVLKLQPWELERQDEIWANKKSLSKLEWWKKWLWRWSNPVKASDQRDVRVDVRPSYLRENISGGKMSTWRAFAAPSEKLQRGGETFSPLFHRATVEPMFACQIIMSPSMPEICSNADCKKTKHTLVLEYNRTYNIPLTVHKGHGLDYIFNVSVMQDQAQPQHCTLHG